jgi:hypothetical protein
LNHALERCLGPFELGPQLLQRRLDQSGDLRDFVISRHVSPVDKSFHVIHRLGYSFARASARPDMLDEFARQNHHFVCALLLKLIDSFTVPLRIFDPFFVNLSKLLHEVIALLFNLISSR